MKIDARAMRWADARIERCSCHGAWTWRGACTVPQRPDEPTSITRTADPKGDPR